MGNMSGWSTTCLQAATEDVKVDAPDARCPRCPLNGSTEKHGKQGTDKCMAVLDRGGGAACSTS